MGVIFSSRKGIGDGWVVMHFHWVRTNIHLEVLCNFTDKAAHCHCCCVPCAVVMLLRVFTAISCRASSWCGHTNLRPGACTQHWVPCMCVGGAVAVIVLSCTFAVAVVTLACIIVIVAPSGVFATPLGVAVPCPGPVPLLHCHATTCSFCPHAAARRLHRHAAVHHLGRRWCVVCVLCTTGVGCLYAMPGPLGPLMGYWEPLYTLSTVVVAAVIMACCIHCRQSRIAQCQGPMAQWAVEGGGVGSPRLRWLLVGAGIC